MLCGPAICSGSTATAAEWTDWFLRRATSSQGREERFIKLESSDKEEGRRRGAEYYLAPSKHGRLPRDRTSPSENIKWAVGAKAGDWKDVNGLAKRYHTLYGVRVNHFSPMNIPLVVLTLILIFVLDVKVALHEKTLKHNPHNDLREIHCLH